jgi:carboxymethylenebutenolidase
MCDDQSLADEANWLKAQGQISRRKFANMVGATGLLAVLPTPAFALDVTGRDVVVTTADGLADCYFVSPAKGMHPGVIIWPDIFGLRPAFRKMADRLAQSGYAVLVVNPYYRAIKSPVLPEGVDPRAPENWAKVREQAGKLTPQTNVSDALAFVAFLDKQKAVSRKRKIGTMGYCMGGPMVVRTAAAVPGRIGAAASFHGSSLASDKPDSVHLLIPQTKAGFLIAIAENDDQKAPAEKDVLRAAFTAANVPAEIEVYAGAMHGWCPPDGRAYNHEQAERAWARLIVLFGKSLA